MKNRHPKRFEITIDKIVYGGSGLGRHQGKVVFVPFSVPGDRLLVETTEERKNFLRAKILDVIEPGPGRREPFCSHFGRCGGCQWQNLDYALQVETKHRILEEMIHHRFPDTRRLSIRMKPSPCSHGYRSRARLRTRGSGPESKLGFYRFQSNSVEDVEMCPLFRPALNRALASVRKSRQHADFDAGAKEIEIACSEETGEWQVSELSRVSAPDGTGVRQGNPAPLRRTAGDFTYLVSPSVFFQANDFMLDALVSAVLNLSLDGARGRALDLFSGVGFFSIPLAKRFRQVLSVENSPEACRLWRENVSAAGLGNLTLIPANVLSWMKAAGSMAPPAFDLILLDPPRAGAGPEVVNQIKQWAPETVLFVYCDPQTLCRDVAVLAGRDYEIDFVEGLDLFPQTYHFETILRLRRC